MFACKILGEESPAGPVQWNKFKKFITSVKKLRFNHKLDQKANLWYNKGIKGHKWEFRVKKVFLILLLSIASVIASPTVLSATDEVNLTDLNDNSATETIPVVEEKAEVAKAPAAGVVTTASVVAQTKNYTVSVYSDSIILDCGNSICKTGKLVYAHNSANLLGNLSSISNGEIFTITENGAATSYRVAEKVVYEKTSDGYLNGNPYLMGNIVNSAMGHSIALMTCTGTSYGNGDASHRLVVYADAI